MLLIHKEWHSKENRQLKLVRGIIMRTGIVGLGLRAGNVLKMLQADMPELELVGYVDPDPCGLPLLEGISNQLQQYESVETLIAKCKLDLLWVASPNHLHLGHIRAGL